MPEQISDRHILTTAPAKSNINELQKESPSQTAGPYVHIGCLPNTQGIQGVFSECLTRNKPLPEGEKIKITGFIYEGNGESGKDLMIESWQADQSGDLSNGIWQRTATDLKTGEFVIETIMPGAINECAPHIDLWIVARGLNFGLNTKIYFEDHDNSSDPFLALIPEDRQSSLIAKNMGDHYKIDINLQGEKETVFFDV